MNRLHKWLILFEKDSREFFASKSWLIVLIFPLFITFLYTVVYREAESRVYTIAYPSYYPIPLKSILKDPHLKLQPYHRLLPAKKALSEGRLDGVILNTKSQSKRILLLVDKSKAKEVGLIIDAVNVALIRAYTQKDLPVMQLKYINESLPVRWLTLPVWLIQIILTVCLLQAAAAIADEKDKQTLLSLLVSPMTLGDYLLEKILWNTVVGMSAIFITLLLVNAQINFWLVLVYGILGCIIYSTISIIIGLFTPGALLSRTIATLTYIGSVIPIMVKDLSFSWKGILDLFPSGLILSGFERSLPLQAVDVFIWPGIILLSESIFLISISYLFLKYKADF